MSIGWVTRTGANPGTSPFAVVVGAIFGEEIPVEVNGDNDRIYEICRFWLVRVLSRAQDVIPHPPPSEQNVSPKGGRVGSPKLRALRLLR